MRYQKLIIDNYKAIRNAEIDLAAEGLVLLLGINESGKTSVLRAVESFDYTNDLEDETARNRFYKSIRNKAELNSQANVIAEILIERQDIDKIIPLVKGVSSDVSEEEVKKIKNLSVTRSFRYQNAEFVSVNYSLDEQSKTIFKISDPVVENDICKTILKICPSIQYFEDFKDQIPDYISLTPGAQWYDPDWASTIEGLFYHTDPSVDVAQFTNLTDVNARQSVLNKVNIALNKQFTNRWNRRLKGTKSIHEVKLVYNPSDKLFTFEIIGADKSTVFAIGERSKGALWYFTFLLKTEFRKRKLRSELGKTLYLIDEPGSNLHSSAQINMVADFRTLASDSNVIYTTHSQYLIDKENLSNVYIVECVTNIVRVKKYQEYLQGKKIKTSFYQPIIDALEIQPFALDTPWERTLIVEGVYDYCGFKLMFESILKEKANFVILPGTGASGHQTLISLHLGWGASLFVLLDNDDEGRMNQKNYQDKFPIIKEKIKTLGIVSSSKNVEFEDLFSQKEREALANLAGFIGPVSKHVFQQAIANIYYSAQLSSKASKILTDETKKIFKQIFDLVDKSF